MWAWGVEGLERVDEEVFGRDDTEGRGAAGARALGKRGTGELDCWSLAMPVGGWSCCGEE